jgi:hypothetical protein
VEPPTPISKSNGKERGPLTRKIGGELLLLKATVVDVGVKKKGKILQLPEEIVEKKGKEKLKLARLIVDLRILH